MVLKISKHTYYKYHAQIEMDSVGSEAFRYENVLKV